MNTYKAKGWFSDSSHHPWTHMVVVCADNITDVLRILKWRYPYGLQIEEIKVRDADVIGLSVIQDGDANPPA